MGANDIKTLLASRRFDPNNPPAEFEGVIIGDSSVTLMGPNGHPYEIRFERMDNAAKVLSWLAHLAGKNWFMCDHVRAIVRAAAQIGIEIDYEA